MVRERDFQGRKACWVGRCSHDGDCPAGSHLASAASHIHPAAGNYVERERRMFGADGAAGPGAALDLG